MLGYKVLCIDPGLKTTGWALFKVNDLHDEGRYIESGVIVRPRQKCDWMFRLDNVRLKIRNIVEAKKATKVVIERPQVFLSGKGQAAQNSSAILKLTGLVFAIYGTLSEVDVMLVGVTKWKGQTPKRITQRRIMKHWKVLCKDHNEADAVGIGDWFIRKYLQLEPA